MKITIKDIQRRAGGVIFERGKKYFKSGFVKKFKVEDSIIIAKVKGSGTTSYDVKISMKKKFNDWVTQCSCPFGFFCKHITAVLLKYISIEDEPVIAEIQSDPFEQIQQAALLLEKKDDVKISFKKSKKTDTLPFISSISSLIFLNTEGAFPGENAENDRYRLIFLIEFESNYTSKRSWITAGLQFIKRDGNPGRIEKYNPGKLTEPLTDGEKNILIIIQNNNDQRILFLNHVDLLFSNRILVYDWEKKIQVHLIPFFKIEINFKIKDFDNTDKAEFKPSIAMLDESGTHLSEIKELFGFALDGVTAFFNNEGMCYFNAKDSLLNAFLIRLLNNQHGFPAYEIQKLNEYLPQPLKDKVKIIFEYKNAIIKTIAPKPFLAVKFTKSDILKAQLKFSYNSYDVRYFFDEPYISDLTASNPDQMIIYKRSHLYENQVFSSIRDWMEDQDRSLGFIRFTDSDYCFQFPYSFEQFLMKFGVTLMDKGIDIKFTGKKISKSKGALSFSITSGIDWFDIETSYEDESKQLLPLELTPELIAAGVVKIGEAYHLITKHDLELLKSLFQEGMDVSGTFRIHKLNLSVIDEIYNQTRNNTIPDVMRIKEISDKLKSFHEMEVKPLPANFNGVLRDYQKEGYKWLYFLHDYRLGGCLADDMGLGKTIQTLALLQSLKERGELKTSLLIVPVVTLFNWEAEIKRFSPSLTFTRHYGVSRSEEIESLFQFDLILISYHTLRNDIKLFIQREFYYVILDEAHNIKNAGTQIYKAVSSLKSVNRLTLTGTPVENSTIELWAQMNFLIPGLLGQKQAFVRNYALPIEKEKNKQAAESLRKKVFPFILRRKKQDVLKDLPDKEEIIYYCEMEKPQAAAYNALKEQYKKQLEQKIDQKGINKSAIDILEYLLRLRQMAIIPGLINPEFNKISSCKFESLKELINEITAEDHKVLIFSQFVTALEYIKVYLEEQKFKYSWITGQTKDRETAVRKFQEESDIKIFLLSLKAGGVGINLTAADYVIIFDPWWNPAVESQAIDRCYRIGQTKKVCAYKMIVKNTIEEKILTLQKTKKELVNDLVSEDASFFKSLSRDDIMGLFE